MYSTLENLPVQTSVVYIKIRMQTLALAGPPCGATMRCTVIQ